MKNFIKGLIKKIIKKRGYDIIKYPSVEIVNSKEENQTIEIHKDIVLKYQEKIVPLKKETIDYVFNNFDINSIAELGCVWGVEGVYGRYIATKYPNTQVSMVDSHWTKEAKELCGELSNITTFSDNFGKSEMPTKIGKVDAVIFFDVLLHQVAPNWDRMLQMYTPYTDFFIIVNPQYTGSPVTVRLLDLGYEEYFVNVPHDKDHPNYKNLFEKMYEINPEHDNRIWRDIHSVWQWGITDTDLIYKMHELGFNPVFIKNGGIWNALSNWENNAFVFKKIKKGKVNDNPNGI
jgi:hypothetical protein